MPFTFKFTGSAGFKSNRGVKHLLNFSDLIYNFPEEKLSKEFTLLTKLTYNIVD